MSPKIFGHTDVSYIEALTALTQYIFFTLTMILTIMLAAQMFFEKPSLNQSCMRLALASNSLTLIFFSGAYYVIRMLKNYSVSQREVG